MLCSAISRVFQRTPPERPPNAPRTPPRTPPKRLPKASQREAPFESKLRKTNDPSLSNTWPPQKGYITQRHSTVSEFCSRQRELRENSSSARSCVRELRENSSSAGAVFSSAPRTPPPKRFPKAYQKRGSSSHQVTDKSAIQASQTLGAKRLHYPKPFHSERILQQAGGIERKLQLC